MKRNVPINKNRFLFIMITMLFWGFINEGFGQSIWTNPITGKNPDPCFYNPYKIGDIFDANITVSGIGRGEGISKDDGDNRYNAKWWGLTTLDETDYFTFTLTPKLGYQINFLSFIYTGQRSDTFGPTSFALRSSSDGFTANIGMPTIGGTTIDLSNLVFQNNSTAIEFRLYAWNASGLSGTFSVNDFTFNGTVSKSTIDFDGADDYVDFGDKHGFTSSFSLEAWVLQKATVASAAIISKGDVKTLNKRGYHLVLNNGKANLIWYNNSGLPILNITSPYAIPTDKWHHIAATYDGLTAKLFIDGLEVATGASSGSPANGTEKFLIGAIYDSNTPTVPKNYFNGYIDEVRIWNKALTAQQIREMMNQEIEINGTAVKGKSIPLNISGGLLWENLTGYYPMNDDTANDESGNAIKIIGSPKNITSSQPQTAPLPYVSDTNGTWDTHATWLNGTVQNLPNTVGINGSTPIDWNIVKTKHDITSGNRNITLLGMVSESGKLTMDGITDISSGTTTGQSLRITHYLELDGVIDLEGESQLLQDEGSILDQNSGGYIERDQQGTKNSFNYNYWSSSVGPITAEGAANGVASTNANFKLVDVLMDGTNASIPNENGVINFGAPYTWADNSYSGSKRISTYWLYTFNADNNNYSSWNPFDQNTALLAGEGYTMKGTSGAVAITDIQNYVFKGKPYNGNFTLPIAKGGHGNRLIGNPYPSAMDANKFIKDNIKDGGSNLEGNIFNGALYFWDHFGERNTHILKEYVGGYATYNLMGGAEAIANDARINTSSGILSSKKPQQYIPVGQGFFVIAALDSSLANTTTTVDGGDIVFKNSQRVFKPETPITSVFMKGGKENDNAEPNETLDKRPKIWLQFDSPTGYHRQLLVGVDENATNHFDLGYDAPIADIGKEDMFWIFDDAKFVIQGVNNFNSDQELPLGLTVNKPGLTIIKIDEIENMDENISVHIKDKLTGEIHNISHKPFEINLVAGTYLSRFTLTFKMQKLVAEDVVAEVLIPAVNQPIIEGIHVFMNSATKELQIKNNSDDEITSIVLCNYLGQTIKIWNTNLNRRIISLPINISTGVYFVQISTKNKKIIKKIVAR
ncbi:MAG: T9SS type A sorting domain-containing protein [Flavobacteriaceae bacterium]|nr:T9SS type A sorting domain-containing protein [Flavobacteriaceae bacterium]